MTEDKGRHYLPRELALLCYNAGWIDAKNLATAVAVCIAESNGYEHAVHVNDDGSTDRGLWQINDSAHPEVSDEVAFNAVRATNYARGLYLDRGFRAWAAYTNQAYRGPRAMGYAAPGVGNFLLKQFPIIGV